jgi:hypothetical protein
MKIINPHIEQMKWVLDDLFHFWKSNNWPLGIDKKIKFIFLKNPENDIFVVDFNQPQEMVVIQIHLLTSYLNFPVELDKVYWKYINA